MAVRPLGPPGREAGVETDGEETMDVATRPGWVDEELFPFESRFIAVGDHSIHYVDEGSGPILLFLHGNPTWSFVYREAIRDLRDRFRCIALDYPAFGLSTAGPGFGSRPEEHAAAVIGFIDALGLEGITLVAQDWGGPIGLAAAIARPEAFDRLILGNTWAWPVNGNRHFERFSRLMGGALGRMLIRRVNLIVNVMIPAGHRLRKVSRAEMTHYRRALGSVDRRAAAAVLPGCIISSRDFLAGVEARIPDLPTLLIWPTRDIAFKEDERLRWERTFSDCRTVLVEGAGHFVQSDAPDQFADAIRNWMGAAPQK